MRSLNQWLEIYTESHRNPLNVRIHTIAVPVIFVVTLGLLWAIPNPSFMGGQSVRIFHVLLLASLVFYYRLGRKVFNFMLAYTALALLINYLGFWLLSQSFVYFLIIIFAVAWVAQFYGHKVEGKKPSFINDLQFLLVGPVWVFRKLKLL